MNTKQKVSIYLHKVSQGAEQHTKRLFLAWHSGVWHEADTEGLNVFLNAHLDRVSSRCVFANQFVCLENLHTFQHLLASACVWTCNAKSLCTCVCVRVCVLVTLWVWRAASPSSMESTEVQADPVSHRINSQRAMLTSPSLPASLPLSSSSSPCLPLHICG